MGTISVSELILLAKESVTLFLLQKANPTFYHFSGLEVDFWFSSGATSNATVAQNKTHALKSVWYVNGRHKMGSSQKQKRLRHGEVHPSCQIIHENPVLEANDKEYICKKFFNDRAKGRILLWRNGEFFPHFKEDIIGLKEVPLFRLAMPQAPPRGAMKALYAIIEGRSKCYALNNKDTTGTDSNVVNHWRSGPARPKFPVFPPFPQMTKWWNDPHEGLLLHGAHTERFNKDDLLHCHNSTPGQEYFNSVDLYLRKTYAEFGHRMNEHDDSIFQFLWLNPQRKRVPQKRLYALQHRGDERILVQVLDFLINTAPHRAKKKKNWEIGGEMYSQAFESRKRKKPWSIHPNLPDRRYRAYRLPVFNRSRVNFTEFDLQTYKGNIIPLYLRREEKNAAHDGCFLSFLILILILNS